MHPIIQHVTRGQRLSFGLESMDTSPPISLYISTCFKQIDKEGRIYQK